MGMDVWSFELRKVKSPTLPNASERGNTARYSPSFPFQKTCYHNHYHYLGIKNITFIFMFVTVFVCVSFKNIFGLKNY
jgi:hypothetical protein